MRCMGRVSLWRTGGWRVNITVDSFHVNLNTVKILQDKINPLKGLQWGAVRGATVGCREVIAVLGQFCTELNT